ncbi:hypothetical protein [Accumulibacter sp.]|uniref:hypothetical protein n=1 Tax=Accumulibacter sp. TaxID=2053492 RepID=UPI0035AFC1FC
MTLEQLRATASAGGVIGVTLKGQGGFFFVEIATRSGRDAVLSKPRSSEPRRVGNPASALIVLRHLGMGVAQIGVTHWNPGEKDMGRSRQGRAGAMRAVHKAAAYREWLAAQIPEAIDDPPSEHPARGGHGRPGCADCQVALPLRVREGQFVVAVVAGHASMVTAGPARMRATGLLQIGRRALLPDRIRRHSRRLPRRCGPHAAGIPCREDSQGTGRREGSSSKRGAAPLAPPALIPSDK